METRKSRRNTAIATLIKRYVNKKSGKVTEARNEIQRRFWALDWMDQKKILTAFLEAGKVDRHWAYKQLLDYWDRSFEDTVRALWEKYHEQRCKWVVIRHLSLEYVRQNMQDFTEERDYYFVCLRLAKDQGYVIEKEKLSHTDYLAVLFHSGREFDEKEGLDILYKIVHNYCVMGIDDYEVSKSRDSDTTSWFFPMNLQDIRLAIYYLEKADCCKPVLAFEEWNEKVKKAMKDSQEYNRLHAHPYVEYDYERRKLDVLRKYAYIALDEKYKMPSDPPIDDILKPAKVYFDDKEAISGVPPMAMLARLFSDSSSEVGEEEILPF